MNLSTIIRDMIRTHKEEASPCCTIEELLTADFIEKFTKFGSLEQFLVHTQLAADAVIQPGEIKDRQINKYIKRNSAFKNLDHLLKVAADYATRLKMMELMFRQMK